MYRNFLSIQPRAGVTLFTHLQPYARHLFTRGLLFYSNLKKKHNMLYLQGHTLKPMYTVLYEVLCALCSTRIETSKKVVNI